MQTRLIGLNDPVGWNAALEGLPHGIAHTHEFVSCLSSAAKDQTFLFVAESAQGKAACPIAERSFQGHIDVYTPYGFGGFVAKGDINDLRSAWTELAKARGYVAAYLMQNPVLMPPEIASLWSGALCGDRTLYTVDLNQPAAERWSDVSKRKRPAIAPVAGDRKAGDGSAGVGGRVRDALPTLRKTTRHGNALSVFF